MRQSTRLVLNTLISYLRMMTTVGIGLTSTRWLKSAVGNDEMGLLNVLGASGSLLLFIQDAMAGSSERHLAHAIGKGDRVELAKVFNTTLVLFLGVGAFIGVLGVGVAPWIDRLLEIPTGRESAARWVFFWSIIGMVFTVLTTPFRAMFVAAQEMVYATAFEVFRSVYQLLAVITLWFAPGDKIAVYSALIALGNTIILAWFVGMSMYKFPESRPRLRLFDRAWLAEVTTYIFWSIIGSASWRLVMQGGAVLMNQYFPPTANASFSYASQVSTYQAQLSQSIAQAAQPAIVTISAKGDRANMHRLSLMTSKYLCLMALFFFVPVQLELEFLLHAWLKDIPPETVMMTRMVMLWMWVMGWTQGHMSAIVAHGKVVGFGILVTIHNLLTFGSMWLVYHLGGPSWAGPAIAGALQIVGSPVRAWYVGRKVNLPTRTFFTDILFPLGAVMGIASLPALGVHVLMQPGWARFIATGFAYGLSAIPVIWWVAMGASERAHFSRIFRVISSKVGLGGPGLTP